MPCQIQLKQIPFGIVAQSMKGPGFVKVQVIDFLTSGDGDTLTDRLEEMHRLLFPSELSPPVLMPSAIDHYLVILDPKMEKNTTLYVNELELHIEAQPQKRTCRQGQLIFTNDIVDIRRLRMLHAGTTITIPPDVGFVFMFSVGWRRALFYDLSPLVPKDANPRTYDPELRLGPLYGYVMHQERVKIPAALWDALLDQRWFPFIMLKTATVKKMLEHLKENWPIDELLESIYHETREWLQENEGAWSGDSLFAPHAKILGHACERYLAEDFISSASILYPRIEGILRDHFMLVLPNEQKVTQSSLVAGAIEKNPNRPHEYSPLLPYQFQKYLANIFFEPFDPKNPRNLSRNTVGHGVAPEADFDKKGATLAVLILGQLWFFLRGAPLISVSKQ